MFKKLALLATAVAALAALAPAAANAEVPSARNWEHNTLTLIAQKEITTHGVIGFGGGAGGLTCPTTGTGVLKPGSTGTITSFGASPTNGCTYTGGLDALCGEVTQHESTKLPWVTHAGKFANGSYGFTVTNIEVHVKGSGAFCPNVTITGEIKIRVDNPHKSSVLHIESGTNLHSPTTGGSVSVHGTVVMTPAETYGIET